MHQDVKLLPYNSYATGDGPYEGRVGSQGPLSVINSELALYARQTNFTPNKDALELAPLLTYDYASTNTKLGLETKKKVDENNKMLKAITKELKLDVEA